MNGGGGGIDELRSRRRSCPNFNHHRANASVRCCPNCGEVVNESIPTKTCSQDEHAKRRRERNRYCVECGEQLMAGNSGN